jgi:DNA-binding LytR/AlgR family response regulator
MRVFVVDDEKPAREELLWLLNQAASGGEAVEIVGQADHAQAAFDAIGDGSGVDVVFLDIDMPGIGGMRLAELWQDRIRERRPLVIFVTAYEEYAVRAFGVDAVDYLLKPVRLARLEQALTRARNRLAARAAVAAGGPKPLQRISVEQHGVYRVIPIDEILYFEAEDGVVFVRTETERLWTEFSLKFLEQNLDPERFFRSHRSYIVRLDAIESIAPWGAGTYRLVFSRQKDIGVPLARSRAAELKSLIPWSAAAFDQDT